MFSFLCLIYCLGHCTFCKDKCHVLKIHPDQQKHKQGTKYKNLNKSGSKWPVISFMQNSTFLYYVRDCQEDVVAFCRKNCFETFVLVSGLWLEFFVVMEAPYLVLKINSRKEMLVDPIIIIVGHDFDCINNKKNPLVT